MTVETITAATLRAYTSDGAELAVFDLRDTRLHSSLGHPIVAVNVPSARLAEEIGRLCPSRATRIVLLDDEVDAATLAAQIDAQGYANVSILPGGTAAWRNAGYELFTGINVPSKAFGEWVEHTRHTPMIGARELAAQLRSDRPPVLLDCRTPEEHHRMTIAGSTSMPGTELVARVRALAPDPSTPVVVHCAGRTRGIVGTQSLIDAGCPNPVAMLENGLIGWLQADQPLEVRGGRAMPQQFGALPGPAVPVTSIDAATLDRWLGDAARTTYVFDVRSAAEFAAGHHPNARHAPGGELLQTTETYVPVRHARVVIAGDDVRARMAVYWLAMMDWCEPAVLSGAFETVAGAAPPRPAMPFGWKPPFDEQSQDRARMQAYIDWELQLVPQIERDGVLRFSELA